jgi:hypothetical protein
VRAWRDAACLWRRVWAAVHAWRGGALRCCWAAWACEMLLRRQRRMLGGTGRLAGRRALRLGAAAALRQWAALSTRRGTIHLLLRAWACAKMLAAVRAWRVRCRLCGALRIAAGTASSLRLVRPLCSWRRAAALQRSDDGLLPASHPDAQP